MNPEVARQLEILEFGTVEITPRDEFIVMLEKSIDKKIPLRVKCGIDPTGTDVHIGHLIPYKKMRQFQDLGHTGVVIIGDYTAMIGDPTGKNESRPALTVEQVQQNAKRYMEQVYTVLDPKKTEIRFQSEWFADKKLTDFLSWAGQTTVAKLLSHDTFRERLDGGSSLGLHELFYPVLQGIDSVFVKSDVELGGSDQKFNVLMGRDYQRQQQMRPQVAMLLPIIMGLDGQQKMSKSLNNYIGVLDEPFDKFGKVMSIPDALMPEYYKYFANLNPTQYQQKKEQIINGQLHPNEAKKELASIIVSFFHGEGSGEKMRQQFENVFKNKNLPDDVLEYSVHTEDTLMKVLVESKILTNNSEVRRHIQQNAISFVDGDKIVDINLPLAPFKGKVLKIGKRKFLKIV